MVAQYDNILQAVNVSFTVGGKVGIVDSSGYVETKNVFGIKIMRLVHSRYDINYYYAWSLKVIVIMSPNKKSSRFERLKYARGYRTPHMFTLSLQ